MRIALPCKEDFVLIDLTTAAQSVQLAVAPVFFLTAVAGMIGAVAGRLARIIDRARVMEERVRNSNDPHFIERALMELQYLRRRGRISNVSIGLLTSCGFLIGLTIIFLFFGKIMGLEEQVFSVVSFLAGVLTFLAALCCFMWETVLATHLLNFQVLEARREASSLGEMAHLKK